MAMSIEDAITANESVGKKAFVLPTTAASTDGRGRSIPKNACRGADPGQDQKH